MREHCLSVSTDCAYVAPQWQFWDRKKVFNLKLLKTETQLNVHIRETGVHDSFSYFLKKKKRKPHVLMGFTHTHTQTHTLIELILCMSDFCNQVCLTFRKNKKHWQCWKFIHILIAVMKSAQVFSLLSQLWTTVFFPHCICRSSHLCSMKNIVHKNT